MRSSRRPCTARSLAPLAEEGVLVVGSGNMTHDLRGIDYRDRQRTPPEYVTAGPAPSARRVHLSCDYGVLAMDAWRFEAR
jgi:aromatic ring-opening dioxygenase catalytic subunit (LigB family)